VCSGALREGKARVRLWFPFGGFGGNIPGNNQAMPHATFSQSVYKLALVIAMLPVSFGCMRAALAQGVAPGWLKPPTPGGEATLEADQQRVVGHTYYADGHVDLRYENARLRADHMEYDEDAQVAIAQGHVQLDYMTQRVEADDARYELRTGRGTFHNVSATFAMQRRPQPTLLVSPNPLYFQAKEAERLDANTYKIHHAWLTVCKPNRPVWKFYAPEATVRLQESVHLENGNFRVFSIPVIYLPYATFPAEKERNSGFLFPDLGNSSIKGYILGDGFYWAPEDWVDLTARADYFTDRGWSQHGQLRMKPWENARLETDYFGVEDRGLEQPTGPKINQGGHEEHLLFTALLPDGWRAVADLDQLSSLTFRLAWSETFTQAVNSEVRNTAFLTNNFRGFSVNFAAQSYQNYLSATSNTTPQTSITLRSAPEARISSVDQSPFPNLPFYFSFEGFVDAVNRGENVTPFHMPTFAPRSELAPSVMAPLHVGPWLSVTPSFTLRTTYYGGQMHSGTYVDDGFFRVTEEVSADIRFPVIERVWGNGDTRWKHTIEPYAVYSYVSGVNDFGRFVRFDEDETLTDTNEFEYGVMQRLFRRSGSERSEEFVTWRIAEKYFLDPTFGGALAPGQRNVFQTLDSLTPFAFADEPRNLSPIVSDVTVEPGKRYDTQFIVNYDPERNRLTAIGALLKLKPYRESFLTLADFSVVNLPVNPIPIPANFEQRSNQVRALVGYGDLTRPGWNVTFGASYDFTRGQFQNQIAEVSYNGKCCGLGVEYRKFSFGTIRNENQYAIVFRIANLGSAGNLRRQEKIF